MGALAFHTAQTVEMGFAKSQKTNAIVPWIVKEPYAGMAFARRGNAAMNSF
ncbi:MAG: hypothetical protein QXD13_01270 [Candidatus Pacearchaeota archaeon]